MRCISIVQTLDFIDQRVGFRGWVHNIREMGGIIFLDLRDRSGIIQTIVDPKIIGQENFEKVKRLKKESVIKIEGELGKGQKKIKTQKF